MMDGQSSGGECQSQVGEVETVCSCLHSDGKTSDDRNVARSELKLSIETSTSSGPLQRTQAYGLR